MKLHSRVAACCRLRALMVVTVSALCASAVCSAQGRDDASNDYNLRLELAFLGLHNWNAAGKLRPAAAGKFDEFGASVGASIHWPFRELRRGEILLGLDTAIFGSDTNVHHNVDNLLVRGLHLTPSVKLVFDDRTGPRYSLDAGMGYYLFDISEVGRSWIGEDAEFALWEESTLGAYLGVTVEFSRKENPHFGFFVSGRIHYLDLGAVSYEGPEGFDFGTLGPEAGALAGPMVMVRIGLHLRR